MKSAIAFALIACATAVKLDIEQADNCASLPFPTDEPSLSAFLDVYSRNGDGRGLRYLGAHQWYLENGCADTSEGSAFELGYVAGLADDVSACDKAKPDGMSHQEMFDYSIGFTNGVREQLEEAGDAFDWSYNQPRPWNTFEKGYAWAAGIQCPTADRLARWYGN